MAPPITTLTETPLLWSRIPQKLQTLILENLQPETLHCSTGEETLDTIYFDDNQGVYFAWPNKDTALPPLVFKRTPTDSQVEVYQDTAHMHWIIYDPKNGYPMLATDYIDTLLETPQKMLNNPSLFTSLPLSLQSMLFHDFSERAPSQNSCKIDQTCYLMSPEMWKNPAECQTEQSVFLIQKSEAEEINTALFHTVTIKKIPDHCFALIHNTGGLILLFQSSWKNSPYTLIYSPQNHTYKLSGGGTDFCITCDPETGMLTYSECND